MASPTGKAPTYFWRKLENTTPDRQQYCNRERCNAKNRSMVDIAGFPFLAQRLTPHRTAENTWRTCYSHPYPHAGPVHTDFFRRECDVLPPMNSMYHFLPYPATKNADGSELQA